MEGTFSFSGMGEKSKVLKTEKISYEQGSTQNGISPNAFTLGGKQMGDFPCSLGALLFSHHFLLVLFHIIIPSSYLWPDLTFRCSHEVQGWCLRRGKRAGHWAKHCIPCITGPFGLTLRDSAPAHSDGDQHPRRSGIPREMCETQSAWQVATGNGSEAKRLSKTRLGVCKGRQGQANVQSLGSGQCRFWGWKGDDTA